MLYLTTHKFLSIRNILLLAIVLRVLWAYFVPVIPVSDSFLYNEFAKSIASGKGYAFPNGEMTAYWPVGTSAIYSVFYRVFGFNFLPIVLLNIFLGSLITYLTYKIAHRYMGDKIGLFSAFYVAIWPILIQFTTILASELLFIFFLLTALYVWGSNRIPAFPRAVIWGAFVCFATYVRPTAFPLILILPTICLLRGDKFKLTFTSFLLATITAVMLFSPWVIRNQQVFGEFVLVSANGGVNLWMGNNPSSNGGYKQLPDITFKNEVERDKFFKQEAIKFIKDNPLTYLSLGIKRAIITYKAETIGVVWNDYLVKNYNENILLGLKLISSIYWWLLLLMAIFGGYMSLSAHKLTIFHPLIIVPAFFFVFPILTVGQDRYHLPLNPFIAILAGFFTHTLILKYRHNKSSTV